MISSSILLKKTIVTLLVLILAEIVIFYFYILPFNQNYNFSLVEKQGKEALAKIYQIVDIYHSELESFKKDSLEHLKEDAEQIVDFSANTIREYINISKSGILSEAEAKSRAFQYFQDFRYEKENYIWIIDGDYVAKVHPDKDSLKDGKEVKDIKGNSVVANMVDIAKRDGEGYYQYYWKNFNSSQIERKISYFKYIPEWDLVIGTGVYLDDRNSQIVEREKELTEKIQTVLEKTKIGDTGYIYIFNREHEMLFHPNRYLIGKDFKNYPNPNTPYTMAESLQKAGESASKTLYYLWDRPDDTGNFIYQKVSWVEHYKPLHWYIGSSAYLSELQKGGNTLKEILIWNSIIILFLILFFVVYISKTVIFPINYLATLSDEVKRGNYNIRSNISSKDEIGMLSSSFNAMVISIGENIETQKRMGEAKISAVSEIVGMIAHQWRQPLTSISNYIYDILETYEYDELSKEYLEKRYESVNSTVQMMSKTIDKFRYFFKPDKEKTEFSICETLLEAIDLEKNIFQEKGIRVFINGAETLHFSCYGKMLINGYKYEFQETLLILLNNAIEALKSVEDKRVWIEAKEENEICILSIKDSGNGVPEELKDKIFQPYFTTKHESFGTGIGLYMAKMIVEVNMDGKLYLEDNSKFVLEIEKSEIYT
jgi:signal transduction histidine kinase